LTASPGPLSFVIGPWFGPIIRLRETLLQRTKDK
jgi:hypothetical protein